MSIPFILVSLALLCALALRRHDKNRSPSGRCVHNLKQNRSSRSSNKIARHSSDGQMTSNFTQHTSMNAKVCGHHCVFVCSPNLGARVPLRGENLYSGRELVDMRLPLGFRRMSRIRPLKENDQCTETSGDSSVATVSWILGCSKPPKYWG